MEKNGYTREFERKNRKAIDGLFRGESKKDLALMAALERDRCVRAEERANKLYEDKKGLMDKVEELKGAVSFLKGQLDAQIDRCDHLRDEVALKTSIAHGFTVKQARKQALDDFAFRYVGGDVEERR